MNTVLALSTPPAKFFLRTPQGRKGVALPSDLEESQREQYLLLKTQEEASAHGWAILDKVETHPLVQIMGAHVPVAEEVEEPVKKTRKRAPKPA